MAGARAGGGPAVGGGALGGYARRARIVPPSRPRTTDRSHPLDVVRRPSHLGDHLLRRRRGLRLRVRPRQHLHNCERLRHGRRAALPLLRAARDVRDAPQRDHRQQHRLGLLLPADHRLEDHRQAGGPAPAVRAGAAGQADGRRIREGLQPLPAQRRRLARGPRPALSRQALGAPDHHCRGVSPHLPSRRARKRRHRHAGNSGGGAADAGSGWQRAARRK